jgi:hypothetical protein
MHLNRRHPPHSNGLEEHYCRRWISVTLLQELKKRQSTEGGDIAPIVGIQRSKYFKSNDEYICISIARPSGERNVSVTVGILLENDTINKIKFLNDLNITEREVSTTCERCGITDCQERAAAPIVIHRRLQRQKINEALRKILEQ